MRFNKLLRNILNRLGYDVIRLSHSTQQTLLGISQYDIGTVIDVGANRGQFARTISKFFPKAKIFCFEPLEKPFRELSSWASTQNGRIHCLQLALGEQEGEAEIHLHEQHTPSSSMLAATDNCHNLYPQTKAERMERIQISTLDLALANDIDTMPKEILLKLDVQGFEDRVLRGGIDILSHCKAVILEVSIDPLYEDQADFYMLTQQLHNVGFQYSGNLGQYHGEDGRVVFLDALFIRS